MTGDKSKLTDFVSKKRGYVTFGDNKKGRIMGEGNIGNQHKTQIKKFYLLMHLSTISWALDNYVTKASKLNSTRIVVW